MQGQNGGAELLFGAMVDYYVPQAGAGAVNLDSSTKEFVDSLQKGDSNLRPDRPDRVQVGGKPGLMTRLNTKTSLQQERDQIVYLYTVAREAGLWYVVLATQPSRSNEFDPIFKQMVGTVQFPN